MQKNSQGVHDLGGGLMAVRRDSGVLTIDQSGREESSGGGPS